MTQPHHYTKADDDLIRRYYNSKEITNAELARRIGVTWGALKYHAACLGLTRTNVNRRWRHFTAEEDKIITTMAGNYAVSSIAAKLKRCPQSILDRMRKLEVSGSYTARENWYTLEDVAVILGISETSVRNMVRQKVLKANTFWGKTPTWGCGRESWRITRESLREYIRRNPQALRNRPFDIVQIVDILAGVKV